MCAIGGVLGAVPPEQILNEMLETMSCRGPDGRGKYIWPDGALLHTRLAVMDPEGGRQPMELNWAGERYVLVYNGELYNTAQLRRELEKQGHQFQTHCDTEVVLHAYAQYGADCVERFNGIFAFAVWEENRRRLFLARDRIGVKPLFYWQQGKRLVFASEIKTVLAWPEVRPVLDGMGAAQLVLLGPGRLPGSGVFRDIREVEPGCRGYWENGKLTLNRYWKLKDREHIQSFDETVEQVRYLVTDAIRRQMVADVPVGTFLSGGLDSSIITALCAEEMAQKNQRLKTFSVDYLDNERYFRASKFQPDSDDAYIRMMTEHFDTDHYKVILEPEELVQALEAATEARDLPGMADVDFSLLAFCGRVRQEVTVALSGECADEIFGGYPWYRDPEVRQRAGFPWAQNTAQRAALLTPRINIDAQAFLMDAYETTCRESDILPGTDPVNRRMKQMVNLNFRWFMQTLLDRKDRMSMYHGLEVRVPFCDHRIAQYLYGVPWEYKDYQGREKGLLRQAVAGLLPEPVRQRKKSPYPKTFHPRYSAIITQRMQTLLGEDAPLWQLVNREQVQDLMDRESPWPWYGQLMQKPQTMAYFLQMDHWLRRYRVEFTDS